ncbi:hypothetical protein AOQ84DRAFT_221475, partial [Glonium stellatum]
VVVEWVGVGRVRRVLGVVVVEGEVVERVWEELLGVGFEELLLGVCVEVTNADECCVDDGEELVVGWVDVDGEDCVNVGIFVISFVVLIDISVVAVEACVFEDETTIVVGVTECEVTRVEKCDDVVIPDPIEVVALDINTDKELDVIPDGIVDGKVVKLGETTELREEKRLVLGKDVGIKVTLEEIVVGMGEKTEEAVFVCTVDNPELEGNEFDIGELLPVEGKDSEDGSAICVVLAGISDVLRTIGVVASELVGMLPATFDDGTCVKEAAKEVCNTESTKEKNTGISLDGNSIVIGEAAGGVVVGAFDGEPDDGPPLADGSTVVGSGVTTIGIKLWDDDPGAGSDCIERDDGELGVPPVTEGPLTEENTEASEGLELSEATINEGSCALVDVSKAVDCNIALVDGCAVTGVVVLTNPPSLEVNPCDRQLKTGAEIDILKSWAAAALSATEIAA